MRGGVAGAEDGEEDACAEEAVQDALGAVFVDGVSHELVSGREQMGENKVSGSIGGVGAGEKR